MKKFIRKVAAVSASSAMLLTTLTGAIAAGETLADLPEPFIMNNAYSDVAVVVGAKAGSNDDAARSTIINYFDQYNTASSDFTYSDDYDEEDNVQLDSGAISAFGEVDSGLLNTLFEDDIEVNDTDYTAREIVNFSTGATVEISSTSGGQDEFGADPYFTYDEASMFYGYSFTDAVPYYQVDEDETLSLDFLGKTVEVRAIDSDGSTGTDYVTMDVADEVVLDVGESYTYKGHTITLNRVFSASAEIEVDGQSEIVNTGVNKKFDADIRVEVDTVGEVTTDPSLSSAVLKLTEVGVSSTVSDGNAFELFTNYDPDSRSPWVWDIEVDATGNLQKLGIVNRWTIDDLTPGQDYKPLPVTVGSSIAFPNDYAALVFDSLTTDNYVTITVTFEDSTDFIDQDDATKLANDVPAVEFSADKEIFTISGTDYDTVYIIHNETTATNVTAIWAEDGEGQVHTTASSFTIDFNDDDQDITIARPNAFSVLASAPNINITANDWIVYFPWNATTDWLGTLDEDEAADLVVNSTNYGTFEYDLMLPDGAILMDPKTNTNSNKVILKIPDQDVEATFRVYTIESSGRTEAVLTTESGASSYDNIVLVGGPCVNSLTASYMGLSYPSCEAASTIAPNTAVIKMVEKDGKMALIVAGWERADTQRAASKLDEATGTSYVVK